VPGDRPQRARPPRPREGPRADRRPYQHAVREHAGTDDILVALAQWWGAATVALAELAAVAERSGGGEDSRRLDRIRVVLARFDWEHDDRQLALEAIERIADGGAQ